MRHLIESADIAIANFENPAPNVFRYHTSGTVFSADPKLIDGLANAGIDWVGIANNHIRDAGGDGILQTIANLKKYGIAIERRRQEPRRRAQAGDPRGGRGQGRIPRLRHDREGLRRVRDPGRQRADVGVGV